MSSTIEELFLRNDVDLLDDLVGVYVEKEVLPRLAFSFLKTGMIRTLSGKRKLVNEDDMLFARKMYRFPFERLDSKLTKEKDFSSLVESLSECVRDHVSKHDFDMGGVRMTQESTRLLKRMTEEAVSGYVSLVSSSFSSVSFRTADSVFREMFMGEEIGGRTLLSFSRE